MKRIRHKGRWLAAGCVLLVILFLTDYLTYPLLVHPAGPSANRGANGLWLSDRWYRAQASPAEIAALAARLRSGEIRYAYIHIGSVDSTGRLRTRIAANAIHLVRSLHATAPGVQVIAWVYAGDKRGRGSIDLASPAVRAAMVSDASWLVEKCGFDGIQWDYEICANGDTGFLSLLKETRVAIGPGKLLSVATPMWLPALFRNWGWSDTYFGQVAGLCDQIVVMSYDSGLWSPRGYVWLVGQQVAHITQDAARANPHCAVLIGVPTYVAGGFSHDPRSENLRLALIGVRDGLGSNSANPSAFTGVAIFADYTTTPTDWQTYARLWPKV